MELFKNVVDDKQSAWIEVSGPNDTHLMICNNGYQSRGTIIGSVEVAKAARDSLDSWIQQQQKEG